MAELHRGDTHTVGSIFNLAYADGRFEINDPDNLDGGYVVDASEIHYAVHRATNRRLHIDQNSTISPLGGSTMIYNTNSADWTRDHGSTHLQNGQSTFRTSGNYEIYWFAGRIQFDHYDSDDNIEQTFILDSKDASFPLLVAPGSNGTRLTALGGSIVHFD